MDDETRRVTEIEAEIAETRVELSETIEAIQERLTPSNIVASATETVRHAATEKVRQMTDNSFMDTVRANPIPAAMLGIGAAWLYFKGRAESRDANGYSRGYPRNVERYNPGIYGESIGTSSYAVGTRGRGAYASEAGTDAGFSDAVGSMGTDAANRAREMADELRDSARQTTRRAQLKFNDVLRDNPLMLGAAAALVGAAIGMSIPATQTENQLMGEARDAVVDRAQDMASEAASKVSEVAESVQTAGNDNAQNVGSGIGTGRGASSPRRRSSSTSAGSLDSTGALASAGTTEPGGSTQS